MKKLILFLSLVVFILFGGIIYLLQNNLNLDSYSIDFEDSTPNNVVKFRIGVGDFEDKYYTTGLVSGQNYVFSIKFDYFTDYELYFFENMDFTPSDIILKVDNIESKISNYGRIISIENDNSSIDITYIDYEELYVLSEIDNIDRNIITYSSVAEISYNDLSQRTHIFSMDYIVHNDKIQIILENSLYLLPGTEVNVEITRNVIEDVYFVQTDLLSLDNFGYFIYKCDTDINGQDIYTKIYVNIIEQNQVISVIDFQGIAESQGIDYAKIYW